jgi:RNA-directed DNA polymerase
MQWRHLPVPDQAKWLASVVRGHVAYCAVAGDAGALNAFWMQVTRHSMRASDATVPSHSQRHT